MTNRQLVRCKLKDTLQTLHVFKRMRDNPAFHNSCYTDQTIALRIAECEQEADRLTDLLIDGGK